MFKKILKITGWVILGAFLIITLTFASNEVKDVKCDDIMVLFEGSQVISINKDEIVKLVKKADDKIFEKDIKQINSEIIENKIEKHETILNAEVYKVISNEENKHKGVLIVKVKNREPVLRILSADGGYYLDENKVQIPISMDYTANVIVATGEFKKEFAQNKLLPLIRFIEEDDFWKAQIEQINVTKNDELTLTPLVGNHIVEFGTVEDYKKKFAKLKGFYEQVLTHNNWNKYKTISLKYENQVIGTKR